jgi:hypothetical protein
MDKSVLFLAINALFYFAIFLWRRKYTVGISGVSFLVLWYFFAAVSSIFFYIHPITALTEYYRDITYEGLLYYNILTIILMYPLFSFEKRRCNIIHTVPDSVILKIMKIILVMNIIVFFSYLPDVQNLLTVNLGDTRNAAAIGEVSTISKKNFFISWLLTFSMATRNLATILSFYGLVFVTKNRKLVILFFVVSMIMPFFLSALFIMRSYMVFQVLLVFFLFLIFKDMFSSQTKKRIYFWGTISFSLILFVLIYISQARFDDLVTWMYFKYAGETFVNFSGQLWTDFKSSTGGTVYFDLFNRLFGYNVSNFTLSEKWTYITNITGIDSHIFYGFIGGLVIEFGFFIAPVICAFISYGIWSRTKKGVLNLPTLILMGSLANLLFTGSFLFVYQGFWGNMEILLIILFYLYINKKQTAV